MVMKRSENKREDLKTKLANKFIFLKMDSCERKKEKYVGINAQFFDENSMEVQIATLAVVQVDKGQTAEYLKKIVCDCLAKFGISLNQVLSITTDNASNMACAAKKLSELGIEMVAAQDDDDVPLVEYQFRENYAVAHQRCAAHTWQLVINAAIKDQNVTTITTKVRDVMKEAKHFDIAKKLKEKSGKYPILDCTTRWDTTFTCWRELET